MSLRYPILLSLLLVVSSCGIGDSSQVGDSSQAAVASVCSLPEPSAAPHEGSWAPAPVTVDGLSRLAYTEGTRLILETQGGPSEFMTGVNLGATVPNHAPGELALDAEDYRRWFPQMVEMGFRALRIYTIHPPAFYQELEAYNLEHPDSPLYVIHGVWIPEELFLESDDIHSPEIVAAMKQEIDDTLGAITGTISIEPQLGHASGTYTADVTPWLHSWSVGVEWDPPTTLASDQKNAGIALYEGTYITNNKEASPTEVWIAEMLDHLAAGLTTRGLTMPLSFVNWPTTDPLSHPDEPLPEEDLVGVDANGMRATDAWPGGYYAAYHAYPYYPDFQRYQPGIANCVYRGGVDNYAGYLSALRAHHPDIPVMVNEFGVPSSVGMAHLGPRDRNQGAHSEQQAMAINADMLRILHDLGFSGGFVFEWADEWFKFTWNTIDYELPRGRRSLWMNPWTNEAHFGMVAVEPGLEPVVVIDGDDREWLDNKSQVISENSSGIREVRAVKDPGYLYLKLVVDGEFAWDSQGVTIGFDVLDGGKDGLPGIPGAPDGYDYAITVGPDAVAQVWVRALVDQHGVRYGLDRGFIDADPADYVEGSGVWNPYLLITNGPQLIPTTGEEFDSEVFNVGLLRYGTSDPADPDFDSRTMWADAPNFIEIRVPYQAIGISDPSSLQAYRILETAGVAMEPFERIGIAVALGDEVFDTNGYAWEGWQGAASHERIKAGVDVFTRAALATTGG